MDTLLVSQAAARAAARRTLGLSACSCPYAASHPPFSPPRSKEGGCGTFIPLFCRDVAYIRAVASRQQQQAAAAAQEAAEAAARPSPAAAPSFSTSLSHALVDPSDPTVVYLTQPVPEQQAAEAPKWAQHPPGPPHAAK